MLALRSPMDEPDLYPIPFNTVRHRPVADLRRRDRRWLNPHPPYEALPANTPMANLDGIVHTALGRYPKEMVTFLFIDDDEPQIIANLSTSWAEEEKEHSDSTHTIRFDARTAKVLEDGGIRAAQKKTFTGVMLDPSPVDVCRLAR
jgi:hypothetical protein